jgi:hypothetical protein
MEKDTNMQDKEFDDLFQSKLDNFGLEPSEQVWQNIDAGLDGKRRNKSISPLLSVAASIIILITAGILFIPKKEVVKPGKSNKNNVAVSKVMPPAIKPREHAPVNTPVAKSEQIADIQTPANHTNHDHHTKKTEAPVARNPHNAQLMAKAEPVIVEPVKANEQPVLAVVQQKENESTMPAAQATIAPVTLKQPDAIETPGMQTHPVLASAHLPSVKQNKPIVKRHGIRNIGDLVNLVVAKVDKRKDKVIEFTDTDDDETTITGVHIGAIRIKRDN